MTTTLQLDPLEKQLKKLLLDAAAYIDKAEDKKEVDQQLVLRWAGGWVRDKLLGQQSHDIDVAINCMTGEVFGNKLRDFCDVPQNREKHNLRKEDLGNLHKIAKNPEKSKNLETATVKIFGLDVDFVNLRTETYAEDSRNPQMDFGTAQEDASRRDATVNALFYNIHTDEVEDFVGGLEDMQRRVIRTPLEPFQTFMDDPLRVLRLVRFASRLGFTIEPPVKEYMGNEKVLSALRAKISRERVGVEVEKMLKGEHPRDAVRYIHELGLYYTVFTDPAKADMPEPSLESWSDTYDFLNNLATNPLYDILITSDEERYLAWVLACVVPFSRIPFDNSFAGLKKNPPAATLAAREGIKAPNKLTELVTAAVRHREEIIELKKTVISRGERMNERDYLGMPIRRWEAQGKHWRLQVLFAILDDVMSRAQDSSQDDLNPTLDAVRESWRVFMEHIQSLDLLDAPSIKPLVDGRQLSKALGIKPGKWMSSALDVCVAWQLRNPKETDPAGAIDEVRRREGELGIAELLK
ncbi:poly A polymerase C-terminal region-like protein [Cryphonectria parasitica EP155]|uniref:Poly A polymerase C-terminal region-like protein n=1 Tax=Cryphonectria parasitica (strain ATCC 38755 / EP155) TaxID=660469 RepID=A0A9P4Y6K9_CRYP1|nr:poly A polymerase C-terminal region-like protein [Cryphonectria parasitica EP155]KAF3767498.1 poly A polymerase C-terminal region-like protein [Cryphonectria parasitica EP155]